MNFIQLLPHIKSGATGGIALYIIVKFANMLAPKFGAGKSWLTSTNSKGIIFKLIVGFMLVGILPRINKMVNQINIPN